MTNNKLLIILSLFYLWIVTIDILSVENERQSKRDLENGDMVSYGSYWDR